MVKAKEGRGRPSAYTDAIADAICERIATGESLTAICADDGMPHQATVFRWLADPRYSDFRDRYACAREAQGDTKFDQVGDMAHMAVRGQVEPQAAKVFIDAIKWQAAKLAPKKYGDKVTTELTGKDGGAIEVASSVAIYELPSNGRD